jgi:hypothetical protein
VFLGGSKTPRGSYALKKNLSAAQNELGGGVIRINNNNSLYPELAPIPVGGELDLFSCFF